MFYYLFHHIPLWKDLPDSKRNIRTFLIGTVMYILFHAFLFSKYSEINHNIKLFRNYIYYLWVADALAMAVIYKTHYKKSILSEATDLLSPTQVVDDPNFVPRDLPENPYNILLQRQIVKPTQPLSLPTSTTSKSKSVFQKLGENSEQFVTVNQQRPAVIIEEDEDDDNDNNNNDNDDDNVNEENNQKLNNNDNDDDSKKPPSKIEEFSNKESSKKDDTSEDEETIPIYN